jgi:hypothetical protein
MSTRLEKDPQQAKETSLDIRLREHRHNLKEGLLEKSKLSQHVYEEGHIHIHI